MYKTVRLQPQAGGEVLARFRQNGFTVDYASLTQQDIDMLGQDHDLTGPIELSAIHMLLELDAKKAEEAPTTRRSLLHSMLTTFTGRHRNR